MIGSQPSLPPPSSESQLHGMQLPMGDEEEGGAGFSLAQIWSMVRAHLWLSIGIFALAVGLAFVVIKKLPKSYQATAALIVNADSTDPLAGRNLPIGLTNSFFPTQVELINNAVVLRPVVDRLKLQNDRNFTGGFVGDPKALDDVVLANLRLTLNVAQGAGSQLLYISATSRDANQAANIANAVAEEYLHHMSQRTNAPAAALAERYDDQLAELKSTRDAAQTKYEEFRQRNGMADVGQNGDQEGINLADAKAQLLRAENTVRQLEGGQTGATDNTAIVETPETLSLRSRLDQLEGEMGKLKATYGPMYPKVIELQKEMDATTQAMKAALATRLAQAREQRNKYQAVVRQTTEQLLGRRALQDEGAKLLQEFTIANENYANAKRGRDPVQFAAAGNYKDVSLVEPAAAPVKPSKPQKMKLFMMALVASFALALGGPFAYELLLDRRIRCRDDLERGFRMVMLAKFEPMRPAPSA